METLNIARNVKHSKLVSSMFSIVGMLGDNKTLTTKEGSVLQVLKLEGVDYTGMDDQKRLELWRTRLSFIETISKEITLTVHYQRKRTAKKQPQYKVGNEYAEHIINTRNQTINITYSTEVYLVVSLPRKSSVTKNGMASQRYSLEIAKQENMRETLEEHVSKIKAILKDFRPKVLTHDTNSKDELFGFWSYLINGSTDCLIPSSTDFINDTIPVSTISFSNNQDKSWLSKCEKNLKNKVEDEDFVASFLNDISTKLSSFSRPYVVFDNAQGTMYSSILYIKDYPTEIREGALDELTSLDHQFSIIQHIRRLDNNEVKSNLLARRQILSGLASFNRLILEEINSIIEQAEAEEIKAFFEHSYQVVVMGKTPQDVDDGIAKITSLMAKKGITISRETLHTKAGFWSQFPDFEFAYSAPRLKKVTSFALNNFCNFGTKSQGYDSCTFGNAPISYFNTKDAQNYGFIFHSSPKAYAPGNTLLVGTPGKGKSVLKSLFMTECLKYMGDQKQDPLKMMVFDNLKGLQVPINALGGQYIDFSDKEINLAPFKLKDSPENRRFLKDWLGKLMKAGDENDFEKIDQIIRTNYENDESIRSLWECRGTIGAKNSPYYKRLKTWLPSYQNFDDNEGRPNAHLFNGKNDPFSFDKRIIGFNMTQVFDNEELLAPITSYVFHSWQRYIEEQTLPNMLIIDEAINFLRNDFFYKFIDTALREFRKKNGMIMFSIQELGSMYTIKNVSEFLGYIDTFILFPNVNAEASDYMGREDSGKRGIGLTRKEFEWIKSGGDPYQFMVKKKDGSSVILNNNLSMLGDYLNLLRGDKEILEKYESYSSMSSVELENLGFFSWQEAIMKSN